MREDEEITTRHRKQQVTSRKKHSFAKSYSLRELSNSPNAQYSRPGASEYHENSKVAITDREWHKNSTLTEQLIKLLLS